MSLDFERIFRGARIPPWLQRFSDEPEAAVEDLLLGRADLAHLGAAEPVEILVGWVENLGDVPELTHALDRALAAWIERSWGWPVLPKAAGSSALTARAWIRAADVLAAVNGLGGASAVLCARFLADFGFLRALSEGRSRDPEARVWFALARHQDDPELIDHWWRLCNLPLDVPWYHGVCGIHGLRGLPAADAHQAGTFPSEVAEGLARLAEALARRVDEGWLDEGLGEEELLHTVKLTMAAYPWPERWLGFWSDSLTDQRIRNERAAEWVRRLFPEKLSEERLSKTQPSQPPLPPEPRYRDPTSIYPLVRGTDGPIESASSQQGQAGGTGTQGGRGRK